MKTKSFFRDMALCAFVALLSLSIGVVVAKYRAPKPAADSAHLSLSEFRAAVDGGRFLVLDARDDVLYARGHVPHALSLPERRFDARYAQLKSQLEVNRSQPIILYCNNAFCEASTRMQDRLQALGFASIAVFPGGWDAWKAAGLPAEKSNAATITLAPWKNPS